jgi:polyisoprenoid-binding protein YceI
MSESSSVPSQAVLLTEIAPGDWVIDSDASTVGLRHKTMWGMVNVKGTFAKVSGTGKVAADGSAHGTVSVDAASIDTKNKKRDIHLRSADFLDVDNHPSITYAVTAATPGHDGTVRIEGALTVRDRTRPLDFTAQPSGTTATAVTLTGDLTIDRKDFDLTWNQMGMMKDITTLTLALRFVHRSA